MIVQKSNREIGNYKHGPLARAVIGQEQVQGLDYAYTLEGWLKGVNSTSLNPVYDMGGDGNLVARDAYSFGLNYFTGDYSPINSTVSPFPGFSGLFPAGYSYSSLYNGNISAMSVNIGKLNNPLLYNYQYDQLNRIVAMDAFAGLDTSNNTWNALTTDNSYRERLSYDANGNIKTYLRNGTGTTLNLNNYQYTYQSNTNRLLSIANSVNSQTFNYDYDAIGNVIKDDKQNVAVNNWNVYGKLQTTQKTDGTNITYTYDAAGNRISKTVSGTNSYTEWYVLDAGGNIMGVYNLTGTVILQTEQHIYGSSRLGIFNRGIDADAPLPAGINANLIGKYYVDSSSRGNKQYQVTDQRGSVLETVSDKKTPHSSNGTTIDYYVADVISATDYSTFGAISRSFNAGNAKNAFDGQRLSPEISPTAQTAQFWEYNGDVGRRWNLDPVVKAFESSYATFANSPIVNIDPEGEDTINFTRNTTIRKSGTIKSNLDNYASKKIPDIVTSTGSINIQAAEGLDVFRIIDNTTTIDEDGNTTNASTTTTLDIRGERSDYRNGGHNVAGFIDDRFALASIAPTSLLNSYEAKNKGFDSPTEWGLGAAKAYQSDVPFCVALQKITNYTYAITGAFAVARMTLVAALPASAGETSFFAGTSYTSKVFKQMNSDLFHGFPEGVKAFEKYGIRSVIKGNDGVEREMLRIPGQYGERNGFFEFIKEPNGSINHRVFLPTK